MCISCFAHLSQHGTCDRSGVEATNEQEVVVEDAAEGGRSKRAASKKASFTWSSLKAHRAAPPKERCFAGHKAAEAEVSRRTKRPKMDADAIPEDDE